jgi:hypothetical protein
MYHKASSVLLPVIHVSCWQGSLLFGTNPLQPFHHALRKEVLYKNVENDEREKASRAVIPANRGQTRLRNLQIVNFLMV